MKHNVDIKYCDAIFKLMLKNGISVDGYQYDKCSNSVSLTKDLFGTETELIYSIDRYNNLYYRANKKLDGSYTQYFYDDKGQCYDITNMFDRYIYFKYKEYWFLVSLDSYNNTIKIFLLTPSNGDCVSDNRHCIYSGSCLFNNPLIKTSEGLISYSIELIKDLV